MNQLFEYYVQLRPLFCTLDPHIQPLSWHLHLHILNILQYSTHPRPKPLFPSSKLAFIQWTDYQKWNPSLISIEPWLVDCSLIGFYFECVALLPLLPNISDEKSTINPTGVPLYVISCFPCTSFKIFFFPAFQKFDYDVSGSRLLFV